MPPNRQKKNRLPRFFTSTITLTKFLEKSAPPLKKIPAYAHDQRELILVFALTKPIMDDNQINPYVSPYAYF